MLGRNTAQIIRRRIKWYANRSNHNSKHGYSMMDTIPFPFECTFIVHEYGTEMKENCRFGTHFPPRQCNQFHGFCVFTHFSLISAFSPNRNEFLVCLCLSLRLFYLCVCVDPLADWFMGWNGKPGHFPQFQRLYEIDIYVCLLNNAIPPSSQLVSHSEIMKWGKVNWASISLYMFSNTFFKFQPKAMNGLKCTSLLS